MAASSLRFPLAVLVGLLTATWTPSAGTLRASWSLIEPKVLHTAAWTVSTCWPPDLRLCSLLTCPLWPRRSRWDTDWLEKNWTKCLSTGVDMDSFLSSESDLWERQADHRAQFRHAGSFRSIRPLSDISVWNHPHHPWFWTPGRLQGWLRPFCQVQVGKGVLAPIHSEGGFPESNLSPVSQQQHQVSPIWRFWYKLRGFWESKSCCLSQSVCINQWIWPEYQQAE